MSFWNFVGGFALLNIINKLFSSRSKSHPASTSHSLYCNNLNQEYEAHIEKLKHDIEESEKRLSGYRQSIISNPSVYLEECDIDELQDRIDELESQLDDFDVMSDQYDRIQDEIDIMQDRLDSLEEIEDIYDDFDDNFHGLNNMDFSNDDW